MFSSNLVKTSALFVCLLFLINTFILPEKAQAKWHSQADDLPGMSTGTVVLIGIGVAAAVTIIVLASKSGEKAKDNEQIEDNSSEADSLQSSIEHSSVWLNLTDEDTPLSSGRDMQFIPYLSLAALQSPDMNFTKSQFDFSNTALMVGVVVRF